MISSVTVGWFHGKPKTAAPPESTPELLSVDSVKAELSSLNASEAKLKERMAELQDRVRTAKRQEIVAGVATGLALGTFAIGFFLPAILNVEVGDGIRAMVGLGAIGGLITFPISFVKAVSRAAKENAVVEARKSMVSLQSQRDVLDTKLKRALDQRAIVNVATDSTAAAPTVHTESDATYIGQLRVPRRQE